MKESVVILAIFVGASLLSACVLLLGSEHAASGIVGLELETEGPLTCSTWLSGWLCVLPASQAYTPLPDWICPCDESLWREYWDPGAFRPA